MHIAAGEQIKNHLIPEVHSPPENTGRKIPTTFKDIIKIGRTHLMDAVPLTLGPGVLRLRRPARKLHLGRAESTLGGIYELALGGTAVGTGLNTHPGFADKAAAHIATG